MKGLAPWLCARQKASSRETCAHRALLEQLDDAVEAPGVGAVRINRHEQRLAAVDALADAGVLEAPAARAAARGGRRRRGAALWWRGGAAMQQ